nr:hypothetical protein [uncultured Dyadobacter sp.]
MTTGTIKDAHIYCYDDLFITAALDINVKGINFRFGGHDVFISGPRGGTAGDFPYLGTFVFRCLEICGVQAWKQIRNCKVLVQIVNKEIIAIGQLTGNKFFNPMREFHNSDKLVGKADSDGSDE